MERSMYYTAAGSRCGIFLPGAASVADEHRILSDPPLAVAAW